MKNAQTFRKGPGAQNERRDDVRPDYTTIENCLKLIILEWVKQHPATHRSLIFGMKNNGFSAKRIRSVIDALLASGELTAEVRRGRTGPEIELRAAEVVE